MGQVHFPASKFVQGWPRGLALDDVLGDAGQVVRG